MPRAILIEFDGVSITGEFFDDAIAGALYEALPLTIPLTYWGGEAYGPSGLDLGEATPRATIPSGGIAYTRQGTYLCLFFGQDPAWPVEYVGSFDVDAWRELAGTQPARVTLRKK